MPEGLAFTDRVKLPHRVASIFKHNVFLHGLLPAESAVSSIAQRCYGCNMSDFQGCDCCCRCLLNVSSWSLLPTAALVKFHQLSGCFSIAAITTRVFNCPESTLNDSLIGIKSMGNSQLVQWNFHSTFRSGTERKRLFTVRHDTVETPRSP